MGTATAGDVQIAASGAHGIVELFFLDAGSGDVTYSSDQPDAQLDGPAAMSVSSDGIIWIADTRAQRLLALTDSGVLTHTIDTTPDGVRPVLDLAAIGDGVWALGVDPSLNSYKLVRYSDNGDALSVHELPEGFHLEDGLSGIWTDENDSVWIEMQGGIDLYRATEVTGRLSLKEESAYLFHGRRANPLPTDDHSRSARFEVDGTLLEFPVRTFGGAFFDGAASESMAIRVEDLGQTDDGVIDVDVSFVWIDPSSKVVAHGSLPLDEAAYLPQEFSTTTRDGRILALIPRPTGVSVVQVSMFAGSLTH